MKIRRLGIAKRNVMILGIILPAIAFASIGVTAWDLRVANLRELRASLPDWKLPKRGERIVIVAPHCDDEIIGAGGLMHKSIAAGAQVWVIFVTNGDGYRAAAKRGLKPFSTPSASFVSLGYRRHEESVSALRRIGVPERRIIELGYPDRGLEPMWVSHWTTPYRSAYTKDTHSPYSGSFTKNAPYTAHQLNSDLRRALTLINPDQVYLPYPSDQHPDHWGTSIFTAKALYDLGWWDTKTIGMYLVHKGDWPVPQGLHDDVNLAPPASLADVGTKWYELPLDEKTIDVKREATLYFKSQPRSSRRFIASFVRQNELFATRSPELELPRANSAHVNWKALSPVIQDAVADGMVTNTQPSADIVSVQAVRDADRIYFRMELAGKPTAKSGYEIRVHPMTGDEVNTTSVIARPGKPSPPGWQVKIRDKEIIFSRPISNWLNKPLMVSAGTSISFYQVDRTAYCILTP